MDAQIKLIGDNIKTLRSLKQISQEKLALNAGISATNLRHIEKGVANPTLQTLLLLSNQLDVSIVDILYPDPEEMKEIKTLYDLLQTLPKSQATAVVHMIQTIINILKKYNENERKSKNESSHI